MVGVMLLSIVRLSEEKLSGSYGLNSHSTCYTR